MTAALPPAMVLAAGFGTRLRPLTDERPKPLCPIGDRPQIDHVILRLAAAGVPRVVVNVFHLAEAYDDAWRGAQPIPVSVVRETGTILGTAGGVANAAGAIGDGECLVYNGDILSGVDVAAVVAEHRLSGAAATLVVKRSPGGRVGVGPDGHITRLRDVRHGVESWGAEYLGIAVLGAAIRARLPREGCLVGDVLIPAMREGVALGVFAFEGGYADTGSLDEYLEANLAWLGERTSWVGEGAQVAPGVELDRVVVGAGARVEGSGRLERCVVWPNATARAPLARAIVTSRTVVSVPPALGGVTPASHG